VSVALFFLNNASLFGNLLLLSIGLLAFLLSNYTSKCDFNSVRKKINSLKIISRGRVAASFSSLIRQLKQTAKDIALFFISHSPLNLFSLHRSFLAPSPPAGGRVTCLPQTGKGLFFLFNSVRKKVNSLKIISRGRVAVSFISPGRSPGLGCVALSGRGLRSFVFLFHYLNPISLPRSILSPLLWRGWGRLSSSFPRQLKQTAKDIAIVIILTLFFAFAGNDATANRLQNDRLLILTEHNHFTAKFSGTTSLFDFAQLTSAVPAPAVAVTSTATGGNWSNKATWVGGSVPVAGDDVIIANGATVTIDTDTPALGSLTIGQGSSGILQFDAVAARTVSVSGIVTIHSGGTFRSAPPTTAGTVKDNLLVVGVSLINNGTLDFCIDSSGAGIKFIGTTSGNSMFNCEGSAKTNLQDTNGVLL
ncbi:MAG: G8 domain-containing protein, partial [Bacteroidota bacterium]|nr:G8 domain-containing protein [Bacteroidota bacterium]